MEWCTVYTATINEHRILILTQKLLNCVRSEDFLGAYFTRSTKFKHLIFSWAYHVFKGLEVIVMGNGYDVLRAFLLEPAK